MKFKHFISSVAAIAFSAATITLSSGCGDDPPPGAITLSGTLSGTPSGYKVKCLTLSSPSSSSTVATDESNMFSLPMTGGVPFGCFVLDTSDVQVASLFFNSTIDSVKAQTIQIGQSTVLDTVTAETSRGTATATVAASIVTSFPGLECPLGVWTGTVGANSDCSGDTVTATLWLGKDSSEAFVLSLALNPHKSGTCNVSAFGPTGTVTYTSDTLSWAFNMGHAATANAEVGSGCEQISMIVAQTGCGTCGSGANLATVCQGSGALDCSSNAFVLNRQ